MSHSFDVEALLNRLDATVGPAHVPRRRGARLVDGSQHLYVDVIPDHRYRGNDVWEPGIHIHCCDALGSFQTDGPFVAFDECRLSPEQIERVNRFIDRWERPRSIAALKPKRRDPRNDSMCIFPDEWAAMPPAVEQAYRRGFSHGVAEALYALQAGLTQQNIEAWLYGPVWRWRYQKRVRPQVPPAPTQEK